MTRSLIHFSLIIFISLIITSCALYGPIYKKPRVNELAEWKSKDSLAKVENINLPMLSWWKQFQDKELDELIENAVISNNDIQVAMGNLIAAKGEFMQVQYSIIPSVSALFIGVTNSTAAYMFQKGYSSGFLPDYVLNLFQYLRSSEAAKARVVAAADTKDAVALSVISQTAAGYFTYLGQSHLLNQQKQLVADNKKLLEFAKEQYQRGLISLYSLQKYVQQYEIANAELPIIENNVIVSRNALKLILNENPGDLGVRHKFMDLKSDGIIPSNLPSQVLRNRPDVRGAEHKLIAANADVGVVTSTFFPSISLTSIAASGTRELSGLFAANKDYFHYLFKNVMPVIAPEYPGRFKSATGKRYAAYHEYVQVIRAAFKSVDDDLSAHQKYYENLTAQGKNYSSSNEAYRLAESSFQEGLYSYPRLLVNKINMDNAAIELTKSKIAQLITIVQLYQDLGGGYAYKCMTKEA